MTGQEPQQRSIWRRIWDFPLVALIVALVLAMLCAAAVSAFNVQVLQPNVDEPWPTILTSFGIVALSIAVYKLAIRKLGTKKHDDLPFEPALKDTALGFAGGRGVDLDLRRACCLGGSLHN